MGKRKNLGGLARFVQEAFKAEPSSSSAQLALETNPNESAAAAAAVIEQVTLEPVLVAGTSRIASHSEEEELGEQKQQQSAKRQAKKRKVGLLGAGYEKYDATGLAPHYTHIKQVPEKLRKYFSQRNRYFSLYAEGCLLDEEGWYSVTPELIADQIADRCRCGTVLDAFCGVGGNAIAFAKTCERVIALDTSPVRLAIARHNAVIYEVADRIEFILADYISFAQAYLSQPSSSQHRKIDVVFLSPPWGGPEYLSGLESATADKTPPDSSEHPEYSLSSIQPIHGTELFKLSRRITPNIAYYLPRNTNIKEISDLLTTEHADGEQHDVTERVEIEEEWMGSKLKALTCYFGGLAGGQEHLFE
ncbi:RNA cap guanine-N2 methyltransferase-domain-containing protein [Cristinia sonorae]|uniref:Trimethylguanosine synthase n=1 Tax=Cristinia sonorae TaxID=1940300 RepID=A0A8K0XSN8_9AGAR|nr:RNA cap guanine-N2 methyltransferase-domain-containing protein [Cristinia sonorae]